MFSTHINKLVIYKINELLLQWVCKTEKPSANGQRTYISTHMIKETPVANKYMDAAQLHPQLGQREIQARTR